MLTVGVTAVGSGIGQPILDSPRHSALETKTIGFEASAWAYGAYGCDGVHCVPLASDPAFCETIAQHCRAEGIEVLIPGSDPELEPLAVLAPRLAQSGCTVIASGPECIRTCRDKLRLYQYLSHCGFPFVSTWSLDEARWRQDELSYPVIVKPSGGSGSVGARVLFERDDWIHAPAGGQWVVQPYLIPAVWGVGPADLRQVLGESTRPLQRDELSIQVMVSEEGQWIGRYASINRLKDGVVTCVDPLDDEKVWEHTEAFVHAMVPLGLRGPCNLQGRITADGFRFFEANPRYTGMTYTRALMGYYEVEAGIRHFHLGEPAGRVTPLLPRVTKQVGLRQMTERAVPRRRLEALDGEGHVSNAAPHERVAITGATGYLGRAIIPELLGMGIARRIVALVRDPEAAYAQWRGTPYEEAMEYVRWTLDEAPATHHRTIAILGDVDAVIHAAAQRPVPGADPDGWHTLNVLGTMALVNAVRQVGVPYLVFVSTQAVYGVEQAPLWREDTPIRPSTPYAYSKAAGEALVSTLAHSSTRWLVMRLARLYGLADGMRWNELPHWFATLAAAGEPLTVYGSGEQRMDLIHVRDAARFVGHGLRGAPEGWNRTYNVGSGAPVSLNELAAASVQAAIAAGCPASDISHRPADPSPSFGMDISRVTEAFGWRPQVTLTDAMGELVPAARERL